MSKRFLAAVLALLLALGGCGGGETTPEETGGGKEKGTRAGTAEKSSPQELAARSAALEQMLAEAPEDCVLAIVRKPDLPRFETLGQPALTMDASEHYPGLVCETLLIVPLADGVGIEIERFELHPSLLQQQSSEVLYQFEGSLGECYALNTYLAETMPSMSVTARVGDSASVWMCTMDGMGDLELEYPVPPALQQGGRFAREPCIVPLSGARALCWSLFGEEGFWQTVAYGIAQNEAAEAYVDTENGREITLSRDRFFSYVETLFPGLTAWPPWEDSEAGALFSYNPQDDSYRIAYFEPPELTEWSLWELREDEDGGGGALIIMVRIPGVIAYRRALEVVWREKALRDENDPIAFEIIELGDARHNLEVDTDHYRHFMESRSWALGMGPEARVDNYLVVDLDGDGVAELLLEASDDSCARSGLYAIDHWETKELLSGERSGGSVGGGRVVVARDRQSGLTVVGIAWYISGFGGAAHRFDYYSYAEGSVSELVQFSMLEHFDDETPATYEVDGEEATAEDYAQLEARFELLELLDEQKAQGKG